MNNYGIKNYDEFKELFIREDGKRKNRVILDMWKDKAFLDYIKDKKYRNSLYGCRTMADLFYLCDWLVRTTSRGPRLVNINGVVYRNSKYSTDAGGICVDGDFRSYRYANHERDGQIFKMKIGKLYKHLIGESEFGKHLPMSVILYMCEEMTTRWVAYSASKCPAYELHVDDDFWRIYDIDECDGDFGSCMAGDENYHFYEESVDAKAAYLTNPEGKVVSRCVIYTKAEGLDGNTYRLAERQYSKDGDDILKRMLVYALIKGGHIDGYKKIGAGCHDPELWMDVNDKPMTNTRFSIQCSVDTGDYISYQDSFKWFDSNRGISYNYPESGVSESLSTTDLYFEGNWDEWNECSTTSHIVTVWYNGNRYTCSEDDLDDFRYVENCGEYHHEENVTRCERCDEYVLNDDAIYSSLTDEYFCCDECLLEAEQDWKENNWSWSEYDDEYVEDVDELYQWNGSEYETVSISVDSLNALIKNKEVVESNGNYYDHPENLETI